MPTIPGSFQTRRQMPWRALIGTVLLVGYLSGCTSMPQPSAACNPGSDAACTRQGAVRGLSENGTLAFKGIPYAQAPVGPLRWRPPAASLAWAGVREARSFGPACPQLAGTEVIGEEDCLTLNVWRPLRSPVQPLPVMIFLTVGGNHSFSGAGAPVFGGVVYNGERLVPEGVVYVSFNYRLGALGFLGIAAPGADPTAQLSGNYGLLDQIAMLRWVRDNIAAFGGDPQRVFLFGTSAGGANLCALMTAPLARGLFHGAAMQSSVPTGCELPALEHSQRTTGQRVTEALSCSGAAAADCLRSKTVADIVRAVPGTFGVFPRLYGPVVDGQVLVEQPRAAIARGAHAAMPVILGNSTEETVQFVNSVGPVTDADSYQGAVLRIFGERAVPAIMAAYPPSNYATPRHALVRLTTDAFFTCQSRRLARLLASHQKQPVYRYLFAHALKNDPELAALGAVHTLEHVFFFPWQGRYRPNPEDLAVQRWMVTRWIGLAAQRLDSLRDPAWLAASPGDAYMHIGAAPAVRQGDAASQCDFWDTVVLPQPHL